MKNKEKIRKMKDIPHILYLKKEKKIIFLKEIKIIF
jgi:hypothetical protein